MLVEVEDFAVCSINFSVIVRPDARVLKPEQRVHPCSKQVGTMFLHDFAEGSDGGLHGFLKFDWRLEGLVSFDFHNVELHFFAEREVWQFNEVDCFSACAFDDFVGYGQNR